MRLLLIFCFYTCLIISEYAWSKKVAIFDYDDRLGGKNTVAKYIEKQLSKKYKDLTIQQFSGRETQSIAYTVLKEIDKDNFDLLITLTSDALFLANHVIKNTPFIFTNVNNPLFLGIDSLTKRKKNLSGATYYVPVIKQFKFYKKIFPKMKKLGIIFDSNNKSKIVEVRETRNAALELNIKYHIEVITEPEEMESKIETLIQMDVNAIVITSSDKLYNNIGLILKRCNDIDIPIFSFNKKGVSKGALAALASDYYLMVDKLVVPMASMVIEHQTDLRTMPIQFLEDNTSYINISQAKKLGITIKDEILKNAKKIN